MEKTRNDLLAFWRQFNEKPSNIPGCPGASCGVLSAGAHSSTAEVEHELMDLWNGVEKDKVVQAARRAAAARNRTRMEPAQPPLKKVMIAVIMATVHEVIGVCAAAASEDPRRIACCLDERGTGSVSDAWPKWLALQASFIIIIKTHLQIGITGFPTRGCIAATSSCCPCSISMEPEKYSSKSFVYLALLIALL